MATCCWLVHPWRLAAAPGTKTADLATVGEFGQAGALVFEGLKSYSREEVISGLRARISYHLAAHPAAPLGDYLDTLRKMVREGYRRGGFPDVEVTTSLDASARRVVVRVKEGPRFTCGEVRLTGGTTLTNEIDRMTVIRSVAGRERGEGTGRRVMKSMAKPDSAPPKPDSENIHAAAWTAGAPAPCDAATIPELTQHVRRALEWLGCFDSRLNVRVQTDFTSGEADLLVEIAEEGFRGIVREIEVTGNRTNTQEQVLEYLKLQPGVEANAALLDDLNERLWRAARFLRHEVTVSPLSTPGQVKLTIALQEYEKAPPLNQEFSPPAQALLKLRDWLADLDNHVEDLVFSISAAIESRRWEGEAILSPSGLLIVTEGEETSSSPSVGYAVVAAPQLGGLYSGTRQRKLVFPVQGLCAFIGVEPSPDAGKNPFNVSMGAGVSPDRSGEAFRPDLRLAPVAFAAFADVNTTFKVHDGVMTLRSAGTADGTQNVVQVEMASGRLLTATLEMDQDLTVNIRSEAGAFAKRVRNIASATSVYPNSFIEEKPWSSSMAFLTADIIRSIRWLGSIGTNTIPLVWALAAALPETAPLQKWFEPLERLDWQLLAGGNFVVPLGGDVPGLPQEGSGDVMAQVRRFVLKNSDALWPRGSWPETLLRECTLISAGQSQYSLQEFLRLYKSDRFGPLGCLAGIKLLTPLNPMLADPLATRGLALISPPSFKKDWDILLARDAVGGEILQNVLKALGGITEEDIRGLSASLSAEDAEFLRHCAQLVRGAPDKPVSEALWPAVEQHWGDVIEPGLQAAFCKVLSDLGAALQQQGEATEAARVYRSALDLRQKLDDKHRPSLTTALRGLGIILAQERKPAEAELLLREALAEYGKLDRDDDEVGNTLSWLARVLESQEKLAEAETTYREALALQKELVGPDHAQVAALLNGLARTLQHEGKLTEAEALRRQELAMQQRLLGREDLVVACCLHAVASVLLAEGKSADAEQLLRESLAMHRKCGGPEQECVPVVLHDLAYSLCDQKNPAEAEPLYREALDLHRKLKGTGNTLEAALMSGLAATLCDQGQFKEAESMHHQALVLCKKLFGEEHAEVARSLNNLAEVYSKQDKLPKAEALHREALAIQRKTLKGNDPAIGKTLRSLAAVLRKAGKLAEAEALEREVAARGGGSA